MGNVERPERRYWVISGVDGYGDLHCRGPCFAAELPAVWRSTPWAGKPHITALRRSPAASMEPRDG